LFQTIGKAVNAPSKVLLAKSRSRQEDAERFRQYSVWFLGDLLLAAIGDGQEPTLHANGQTVNVPSKVSRAKPKSCQKPQMAGCQRYSWQ